MKLSARNILKGKVLKVVKGAVNSEVTIELPGGEKLVSIITNASVASLGLEKRQRGLCSHQGIQHHGCCGRINTGTNRSQFDFYPLTFSMRKANQFY